MHLKSSSGSVIPRIFGMTQSKYNYLFSGSPKNSPISDAPLKQEQAVQDQVAMTTAALPANVMMPFKIIIQVSPCQQVNRRLKARESCDYTGRVKFLWDITLRSPVNENL